MTPEQENHLNGIIKRFEKLVDSKYRKGQREHGGNLFDAHLIELVDWAIDEAIDQVVYLLTLRDKIINEKVGNFIVHHTNSNQINKI